MRLSLRPYLGALPLVVAGAQAHLQQQPQELLLQELIDRVQQGLAPIAELWKLLLLMNLKPSSYSSKSEDYRAPALAAYKVSNGSMVLCQVSDRYFPAQHVKAAHIVRLEWSAVAVSVGS